MTDQLPWGQLQEAIDFAVAAVRDDPDPCNEREAADGNEYVVRMLTAVCDTALLTIDPSRPAFMPMMSSVRHVGASGPDIDYDVAMVLPGTRYRITGDRGGATSVGIAVYGHSGDRGASGILAAIDVDDLAAGEALVIDLTPPQTRYWGLQVCDRWFQAYPQRRSNLNDRAVTYRPDGSVQLVLSDGDPGHPNWLDTSGHRIGTMFFRWLHADPEVLPTCRVVHAG